MTRRVTVLIEADDVAEAMRSLRGVAHGVTVSGGELVVECSASDVGRVERICFARGYACETRRLRGAFKAAFSRLGAVVAAAAVVLCLMLSQLFVTDVEVRGVDASASAMIKAIAMSEGVDGLTLKSRIDVDALALEIERQTPGVTAVEAFFEGGRLVIGAVPVDERPSSAQKGSTVVADVRAIITRVVVFSGTSVVKAGDVVAPGDVLIEGTIDVGTEEEPQLVQVGADGVVYARVFESERLVFPPTYRAEVSTGRTFVSTEIAVGGRRIWTSGAEHGFARYEARTDVTALRGIVPVMITRTVYEEKELVEMTADEEYIADAVECKRAELMMNATGTILSEGVNRGEYGGYAYAEIYIETERQIGRAEV